LAILERNRQLVDIGAYERGSNAALDQALEVQTALNNWLSQSTGGEARSAALQQLAQIIGGKV